MDLYQQFIHKSRYARYLWEEDRRESWEETVERYFDFFSWHLPIKLDGGVRRWLQREVLDLGVMPSMRALMTAGPALERSHAAGFNCCFVSLDSPRALDEALWLLMCGAGVGFSVERRFVDRLPDVPSSFFRTLQPIVVEDSKEGWATAYRELLFRLWNGMVPDVDYSEVRPAGAPLKVFGGRASGPEPLRRLCEYTVRTFRDAAGRRLRPIEVHDLMCLIGEIVVVGGVRRSALISLSDLDDAEMRDAKSGEWWRTHPHRALANNSAVYEAEPSREAFDVEWAALVASGSGERGIFNRQAARFQVERFGRRDSGHDFGVNPCGEILLRPQEACNLSEAVARPSDSLADLKRKVRAAAILGTWQSTLTDWPYVRPVWRENLREERLLGVSLTGIMDSPLLREADEGTLQRLRDVAVEENAAWARVLGIPQSKAVTCTKPSGTVSQLVDSSSGIHARFSERYVRRVRNDMKDPVTAFLRDQGVPCEPCVLRPEDTAVFSFPKRAPDGASTRHDGSAVEQLETWLRFKRGWCEHNPSVTINVRPEEWAPAGEWVRANFDQVLGVSFLPHSDHVYQQAPYEDLDQRGYEALVAQMPTEIDWDDLKYYESGDQTTGVQQLACVAGVCEI